MSPDDLSISFGEASKELASALYDTFKQSAEETTEEWRSAEAAVAGAHGRPYVRSLSFDMRISSDIVAEMGPDASMKQGKMSGFELGSENQRPHLTGLKAVAAEAPRLERRTDTTIAHLLP